MAAPANQTGYQAPMGLSGADPSSHPKPPPAPTVEAAALTDEERCLEILSALGLLPPSSPESGAAGSEGSEGSGQVAVRYLPLELILRIACRASASRRAVEAMRSTCPLWRREIPGTSGPLLVLSRSPLLPPGEAPNFLCFDMVGGPLMAPNPCIARPPANATVWGAAHGFLALEHRHEGPEVEGLSCFCMNCSGRVDLLPLPEGMMTGAVRDALISGGIFDSHEDMETPYVIFASQDDEAEAQTLHYMFTALDGPLWEQFPGTGGIRGVNFLDGLLFVGVSHDVVSLADHGYLEAHQLVNLPLDNNALAPNGMATWANYGLHVFSCEGNLFICSMFRSVDQPDNVSAAVLLLEHDPAYALRRVQNIGNFAVYLGGNQSFVLPAVEGSSTRRANTVYILNDDGVFRTADVLVVDIASGLADIRIPFPPNTDLEQYGQSFWVVPPPLDFWHCSTELQH